MISIGIFSKDFNNLSNLEYRFYEWCKKQEWINIKVFLIDGRNIKKQHILKKIFNFNIFSKLLFICINKIDIIFNDYTKVDQNKKNEIIEWLKNHSKLIIKPIKRKGNIDYFDENLTKEISKYNLDLILRFDLEIIKGNILKSMKYGIWSFHHADNDINRGGPAGFWEVYLKQKITGVTLQRLNDQLDGGEIIEKGYYPTQPTFFRNNSFIIEKSLTILIKNIKLINNNSIIFTKSKKYNKKIYKYPTDFKTIFKYLLIILRNTLIKKIIYKFYYILNYHLHHWTIYIANTKNFFEIDLNKSYEIKTKNKEFYADPFFINKNNKDYLFFENFNYNNSKGSIACATIDNNQLYDKKIILNKNYHMSYPFIFEENNNIYLLPEMSQAMKQDIYKVVEFPYKWELYKTLFKNQFSADPTIYKDQNFNFWLFINQSQDPYNDLNSELYIYKILNFETFNLIPHKRNPVIIDSRRARNAGSIFTWNKKIIRPSQNSNSEAYGNSLNFYEIIKLDINNYEEKFIYNLNFNTINRNIIGTHHYSLFKDKSIIDICFKNY